MRELEFTAISNGQKWVIRCVPMEFVSSTSEPAIRYYEASSDGINLTYIAVFNEFQDKERAIRRALESLRERERKLTEISIKHPGLDETRRMIRDYTEMTKRSSNVQARATNQAGGAVRLGFIPRFDQGDLIAAVWLAYCSQGAFASLPSGLAPAFFHEQSTSRAADLTNHFVPAQWELADALPALPKSVSFTNDGSLFGSGASRSSREAVQILPVGNFSYLQASFHALEVERFGDLTLPRSFRLEQFQPQREQSTVVGVRPFFTVSGELSHVEDAADDSLNPEIEVLSAIRDFRFATNDLRPAVAYRAEPGSWKSMEQVAALPEFRRALETAQRKRAEEPRSDIYLLLLFFLLSFPLVLLWRHSRAKSALAHMSRLDG